MGAVSLARKAHKYYGLGKLGGVMAKLIKCINRVIYSCDIAYSVDIPKSTSLPHQGLGVVIHPATKIGEDCVICQNVTLGQLADGPRILAGQVKEKHGGRGHAPSIGNNVLIGAGACILGGIIIGNNVSIAANAVVLDDVPDNAVAAGIPAKIKKYKTV